MNTPLMTRTGIIHMEDIPDIELTATALADTLAKINRYAGRTVEPWSVAAHSVLVSRLCPHKEEQAWALLHDGHEAFIGDVITPALLFFAKQIPMHSNVISNSIDLAKIYLDRRIISAWQIDEKAVDFEEVAHYDLVALYAEMSVLFGDVDPEIAPKGEQFCADVGRAREILLKLPNHGDWRESSQLWVAEAERLAQLGACVVPSPTNRAA